MHKYFVQKNILYQGNASINKEAIYYKFGFKEENIVKRSIIFSYAIVMNSHFLFDVTDDDTL